MNTTFSFTVSSGKQVEREVERILLECHALVAELEGTLSEFRKESDLTRLMQALPQEKIEVSHHVLELLEESNRVANWSRQAFNPAFRSGNGLSLRENFSWSQKEGWVMKLHAASRLGFGAIGKGYALDLVHQKILNAGFPHHRLIAGGSSLIFSGYENENVPWTVGFAFEKIDDKFRAVEYHCLASPLFIGVSGNLEQGEHIVSNCPSTSPVKFLMAGVSAKNATRADAFSTAIYADPTLAENYIDGGFILIDNEERLYSNTAFQKQFRGTS